MRLALLSGLAALCLVSCGGGGSGGGNSGGGGGPVTPAPTPEIRVSLSQTEGSTKVSEASTESSFTFTANATTTGALPANVHANLQYDADLIKEAVIEAGSVSGTYVVHGKSRADLGGGQHVATIVFRLCQDADCKTIYPGSTQNYTYKITSTVAAWNTWQGNSKRNGYVNITIDPSKISRAWTHENDGIYGDIVSDAENFYFHKTYWKSAGVVDSAVVAVRLSDGEQVWSQSLGVHLYPTGLSMLGDRLHLTGRFDSPYEPQSSWIINKTNGAIVKRLSHAEPEIGHVVSVPSGNSFLTLSGLENVHISAYAASDGARQWKKNLDTEWGRYALAADDDVVVFYSRDKTKLLNVLNGEAYPDLLHNAAAGYADDFYGGPVIADNNTVLLRSERNQYMYFGFPIKAINRVSGKVLWTSTGGYESDFAYAKGVIYAIHTYPRRLDAIDAENGTILWSWESDLPEPNWGAAQVRDEYSQMITGNVVVTNNLLFVSVFGGVKAIDLKTRKVVWTYNASGHVSISSDGYLIIAQGGIDTVINRLRVEGPVTAFKFY